MKMWNKLKGSRLAYGLLAVLCAVALWLYVDITTEPDAYTTIRNIPVTILGEDELSQQGLMITDVEDSTVTLKLTGVRAVISQMDRDNVSITADAASQITEAGEQELSYTITWPSNTSLTNFSISSRSPSTITVTVTEIDTKEVSVSGVFTGSVADGYLYDSADFQLGVETITVSGEASLVEQIDHAQVVLDATELTSSWSGTLPIQLVTADGTEVEQEELTLSATETEATFPVRCVKEVPLKVTFQEGGGATEDDVTYEMSQETLLISGTEETLTAISELKLGTIDLSQVITSEEYTFTLQMPEGVTNESGYSTVTVSVKISGLTTQKVETSDIRLVNIPDGISATLVTESLEVRIRGDEATMALLTDEDVYVEADLSEIDANATGTCTVPAEVKVQGMSDIGAIDSYSVVVEISEAEAGTETATGTATDGT
ncbi:MAG: hypothetical protein LUG55_12200 [Clostridiales bacterium]|nr:hypothetical protein [Clostridiales bacterium]